MFIELRIKFTVWKLNHEIKNAIIKGYSTYEISEDRAYCPKVIDILKSKGYQINENIKRNWDGDEVGYQVNLKDVKLEPPKSFKFSDLFKQQKKG